MAGREDTLGCLSELLKILEEMEKKDGISQTKLPGGREPGPSLEGNRESMCWSLALCGSSVSHGTVCTGCAHSICGMVVTFLVW